MKSKGKIYCAGPMRGIKYYNFPAFDKAALMFRKKGWRVVNPAELDRVNGAHEFSINESTDFLRQAMKRDLTELCDCTAIALLPGWRKSAGTFVELALARLLNLEIYDATTGKRMLGVELGVQDD